MGCSFPCVKQRGYEVDVSLLSLHYHIYALWHAERLLDVYSEGGVVAEQQDWVTGGVSFLA
jgi:hypothetical protein